MTLIVAGWIRQTHNALGTEGWKELDASLARDPLCHCLRCGTPGFHRGDFLMSAEIRRDILEIEKLRQDIETELACRHNWAEQERFWAHEAKLNRSRNYIAVAAIAATITLALVAALVKLL